MATTERTPLIRPHQNGENGWQKLKQSKHIIQIPKDLYSEIEDFTACLSLEELLPYQDDPWWQKLRNTIFYSFWFVMLLTLLTACALASMHAGSSFCQALTGSNNMNLSLSLATDASGKLAV